MLASVSNPASELEPIGQELGPLQKGHLEHHGHDDEGEEPVGSGEARVRTDPDDGSDAGPHAPDHEHPEEGQLDQPLPEVLGPGLDVPALGRWGRRNGGRILLHKMLTRVYATAAITATGWV